MKTRLRNRLASLLLAAAAVLPLPAAAAEVKVGVIGPFTGPYAYWGNQFKQAIELYLAENGGKASGHDITVIYRDDGGANPQRTRQLAQELATRDEVQYLAGFAFTPTALAVAEVANEAQLPAVVFNAGTSMVTRKSPFFIRTGFTQWTVSIPITQWAAKEGKKACAIVAADYAPGYDAVEAFTHGFTNAGGKIVEVVKVPLNTPDFSSYLQRVKDQKPDCVFMFMPVGPMSVGFVRSFVERGLKQAGIELYASAETQEADLPPLGDAGLGLVTALHYGPGLDTPANKALVGGLRKMFGTEALPNIASVAAYDGMKVIAEMVRATDGRRNGVQAIDAIKGFAWDSPRGQVSIDPKTRDIVNNVYIRRVEKRGDALVNVAIHSYLGVKEPWLELNPEK